MNLQQKQTWIRFRSHDCVEHYPNSWFYCYPCPTHHNVPICCYNGLDHSSYTITFETHWCRVANIVSPAISSYLWYYNKYDATMQAKRQTFVLTSAAKVAVDWSVVQPPTNFPPVIKSTNGYIICFIALLITIAFAIIIGVALQEYKETIICHMEYQESLTVIISQALSISTYTLFLVLL